MSQQDDLVVIEQMKQFLAGLSKMCSRSEKSFKVVLSDRLLETAFQSFEFVMRACEVDLGRCISRSDMTIRLEHQKQAYQKLRTLDTFMSLSPSVDGLISEQFEVIAKRLKEITVMIHTWCRNDIERVRKAGVDVIYNQIEVTKEAE